MLDIKFIRENVEIVKQNIANKNESADLNVIINADLKRREIIQEVEALKNKRNIVSNEIAVLKKNKENADDKILAMKEVSDRIKELDEELRKVEEEQANYTHRIPNMVHSSVPVGKSADDNLEVRAWGTKKDKIELNHMDITKKFGIIDFERGAKVSGAGFAYYIGKGAALERALINYMLDYHINNHGYTEMMSPLIVTPQTMFGTGQLPKMAEDMYFAEKDNLYLIPTAEVPITNFHSGETLKVDDLTMKYCGYTPCFRREAGSYGKDSRGFLRVHQFNKVELVKFSKPEDSYNELELLVNDVEKILQNLKITYRVLLLCSGDTSFSSAKTYDLEVWSPAEDKWLEASSCSNFEDFQARRAVIKFKRTPNDKPEFVHTLNGSGLATSRLMVAIIENYYQDGKLIVPEVLRPYTKFDYID
jgi:seryl-tRNA synthetase